MRARRFATLALILAVGCSSPVLIRRQDATYRRALDRLERARRDVERDAPSAAEATMFLQAEALYRYRFEPPPRTVGNLLAQTLAVATEFAPLQALATSAGLFELRLRIYDGATHLWETLLEQHPETPLRPLVLYRLGWAYRSTGTSGFPRDSDQAFDEILARYPRSRLAPLALSARQVPWKSQDTAIGLSIVPGLGQVYSGEYLNGAARFAIALACAALIVVPGYLLYRRIDERDELVFSKDWPYIVTPFVGIILLNVAYTTAYQDAVRAAVQWNERAEAAFEDRHPEAP